MASLLTGVLSYLLAVFPFGAEEPTGGGAAVVAAIAMAAFLHSALE